MYQLFDLTSTFTIDLEVERSFSPLNFIFKLIEYSFISCSLEVRECKPDDKKTYQLQYTLIWYLRG